jgi:transposase-like protein
MEALKERQTMSELTAKFGVHSTQIGLWKKQLLQEGMEVFKQETKGKKKISNYC